VFLQSVMAVGASAGVAAVVAGLGRRRWWGAAAVGLAYVAGHAAVARPAVPPVEVTDRLPWVALAAAALAVYEAARPSAAVGRGVGRCLLGALTLGLMLGPVHNPGVVWFGATVAVALASWVNLGALAAGPQGSDVFRGLLITAGGAGVVLLLSGSAVLGILGLALTAALAGGWLGARGVPPEGSLPTAAVVLGALVLEGYVYASLPASGALLLAAAPAGTWVGRLGPARRLGPWASATLGAACVLVPVGIAVGLAVAASLDDPY